MSSTEITKRNLILALKYGVIDWFQYLDAWRKL